MATDVGQSCYGWTREESADQDDSRKHGLDQICPHKGFNWFDSIEEISVAEMLDHGSISFGRFALEPLSWEKRSVFIHNSYQEEIEKFKAPGLVAQKKAYFEEHYKKIRAIKALQENQHANGVEDQRPASDASDERYGNAIENVADQPLDESSTVIRSDKNNQPVLLDVNSLKSETISSTDDSELVNTASLGNNVVSRDLIPNGLFLSKCLPTSTEIESGLEQKKVKPALETCEGDALTSKKPTRVRSVTISECKTKCTVTVTHALRNSSQKRTGKPNDSIPCKQTVGRVQSRKDASVVSHGPLEEMPSKVITRRSFVFPTEKRSVPSVSSASTGPHSKTMDSLPLHSKTQGKADSNIGCVSKIRGDAKRKQVNDEKISSEAQGQGKPTMIHQVSREIQSDKKVIEHNAQSSLLQFIHRFLTHEQWLQDNQKARINSLWLNFPSLLLGLKLRFIQRSSQLVMLLELHFFLGFPQLQANADILF
ncbi:hypothetical protein AXF42_Ash000412 [Apostasia shenzhenica]|uniref:Protein WVD2-like 7 n=1 Tax=Apostasia shenzhenica TaxID=1088818 RepID=A0A2I0AGB3_9ASPA|nr:hypothetical protein AXF42_Ash000412 [Apostasia shenzhenica]